MSLKAVVDTNIIISGAIKPRGTIGAVLQRLRQRTYALLLSRATLDEIVEVLHRPHLRRKYQLSERTVRATLRMIVLRSEFVTPDVKIAVCRDPHDDTFLEVAVTGKADVIVSGDNDLLTMTAHAGIPIVSANQFLTMLESPDTR